MNRLTDFINKIICSDCENILKQIPENSIDCVITDPPYGMNFMGKKWDKALPDISIWKQCSRILKSGAFMFVFCIPRSDLQWRMMSNIEKAGFEINMTPLYWTYSSGFPKALNISKAVDKHFGAKRKVAGYIQPFGRENRKSHHQGAYMKENQVWKKHHGWKSKKK